jgi:hypothetical protein
VCRLAKAFPEVTEGTSYGTPSLKAKGRFMARLKEDGETLAIRATFADRDALLQLDPDVFYLTDHYLNYEAVLVRLPKVRHDVLARVVENAWRMLAPKKRVAAHDAARKESR